MMRSSCLGFRGKWSRVGKSRKPSDAVGAPIKIVHGGGMSIKEVSKRLERGVLNVYGALQSANS